MTPDDIPAIVEAVVDMMHSRVNLESGSKGRITRSSTIAHGSSTGHITKSQRRGGRQVTRNNADSQATHSHSEVTSHHATDSINPASEATGADTDHMPPSRNDTESKVDQEISLN